MHCLKPIHDSHGELHISLIPSHETHRIDRKQWQQLQLTSLVKNPFFEDWNLIPAMKHLAKKGKTFIVTIHSHKQLIALFPIVKTRLYGILPSIQVWQHNHAYQSDPLHSATFEWSKVLNHIASYMNCAITHIPNHAALNYDSVSEWFSTEYHRASIQSPSNISQHMDNLSGKTNRELKRLNRKLNDELACEFIEFKDLHHGLEIYKSIEHKGWKGNQKGSILSSSSVTHYYDDMIHQYGSNNIRIFGLSTNGTIIACALRIISQNHIFEIKTSYDERYKRYAPGKALEWYLLNQLSKQTFHLVDSCTHPDNSLINWLWPDQITYYRSYIFAPHLMGRLANQVHNIKQWFHRRHAHA